MFIWYHLNSVFTPYYSETVLYSSSELRTENEDGISTLFYLQKIFPGILPLVSVLSLSFQVVVNNYNAMLPVLIFSETLLYFVCPLDDCSCISSDFYLYKYF